MKFFLSLIFLSSTLFSIAQKKNLDHTVYNDWKSLRGSMVSNDGSFVSYEINPHRGDGHLYLFNAVTNEVDSFPRGKNAMFSNESDFFTFRVKAGYDTLRTCELEDVDKKEWPKDSLFIIRLADMDMISVPMLKSIDIPENGEWLAYSIDSTYKEPEVVEEKKKFFQKLKELFKKKKEEPKKANVSSKGKIVYLYQPSTETKVQFNDIMDFSFSAHGDFLIMKHHQKVGKEEKYSLNAYDVATGETIAIDSARKAISKYTTSKTDKFLAYLATSDTAKVKNNTFYLYDLKQKKNYISLDSLSAVVGAGNVISPNRRFTFTDNEKYLFLGVDEAKVEEPKDSLLTSEKAKLDVWHYQEKRNQPMQLLQLSRDKKASDLHVLNLDNFKLIPLTDDTLSTRVNSNIEGDYIMASSDEAYSNSSNWDFPFASDHYRISLIDGTKKLLRKKVVVSGEISPSGRYYLYFSAEQGQHYVMDVDKNTGTCVTCSKKEINWQSDGNGMPTVEYPLGIIGWERGEEAMYIQSEFDIWKFDMNDRSLTSITNGLGKEENIEFRARVWEYDSNYVSPENMYLRATDLKTKDQMIYQWIDHVDHHDLVKLYQSPHRINSVQKSEDGSRVLVRKSNVADYADVFMLDEGFKNEQRISNTNPQQKDYNWATVELMDYTSRDGEKLQALMYKPENFDANKKYPLLVYFYEMYTDRMHSHYSPRPTASIIYPTEYASAGYMVLIPDIRYIPGHPAKSAYNCIMGSTDAALKLYPNIDSTKMGLQGQSWGGYQTAQLVTMTTRYAAAMAGAPVSNMFSAYGGIRWGSGMNRQFQYERTQSRIGKTIWEAPALYVENSPLFHLPKVKTPLLIMHNDGDGAVPWYQGIELFMGMKRLGKPCWMLNYNDDGHNLMKNANRMDLSIRMRQFFDYYLLDAPAPRWLIEGVPAIDKGVDYRLDLMEE